MKTLFGWRPNSGSDIEEQKFPFSSGKIVSGLVVGLLGWVEGGISESNQSATSWSTSMLLLPSKLLFRWFDSRSVGRSNEDR